MALGAKEAASSFILSVPKFNSLNKSVVSSSIRFNISISAAPSSLKFNLNCTKRKPGFLQLHAAVVNLQQEEKEEEEKEEKKEVEKWDNRRKLFVLNLPWAFSVVDIKKLFGECGVVDDVEIIKQKDGKSRGFAFVTMATGEEAQAAILKYDSHELSDRIIRVEFAKQFKRPIRTSESVVSSSIPAGETRHKLYVSNLGWKVRSTDLREFFSSKFKPLSVKVVFDSPSGKSAGYGFVSFATKEEADSAISQLNGTELLGRPVRLKAASEKNIIGTSQTKQEKEKEESSEKSIIDNSQNKEEEESTDKTSQSTQEE
ncbi:hypothetical protein ABFX02_01G111600 [Erythranthe guttata]